MIYLLEAERRFPSRVRISLRAVGWVESEVQHWLASRIEQYRARPVDKGLLGLSTINILDGIWACGGQDP
jgi:hypothetical protein